MDVDLVQLKEVYKKFDVQQTHSMDTMADIQKKITGIKAASSWISEEITGIKPAIHPPKQTSKKEDTPGIRATALTTETQRGKIHKNSPLHPDWKPIPTPAVIQSLDHING